MQKIRYTLLIVAMFISIDAFTQERNLVQVVVGNEGNFGAGNATLTNFMVESGSATDGVFLSANGIGVGDVLQSLSWYDGQIYAVVNNSQKIVILNDQTFEQEGQITLPEGASPREMIKVSESKAYVTDLYASLVYVVDLQTRTLTETTIPAGLNADRMIHYQDHAYIANYGFGADSTIFKVDISTDAVVDTFTVSRGPAGMQIDAQGTLWVVCAGYPGDFDENFNLIPGTSKPGGIHGINLSTGQETSFAEISSAGTDLALAASENKLYLNAGGLRSFDIETGAFSPDTLVKGSFYALGYEEENEAFYLADAKDFSSRGDVIIYRGSVAQADTFQAGIIPGSFLFIYDDMLNTSLQTADKVTGFALGQNYPNPFNPTTEIQYSIDQPGNVKLEVFNITGQKIGELVNERQTAGSKTVQFDGTGLSSGLYIYRISTPAGSISKKMTLIK
jgi:DNA-binding beta-propeller fold protein YncE